MLRSLLVAFFRSPSPPQQAPAGESVGVPKWLCVMYVLYEANGAEVLLWLLGSRKSPP